MSLKRLPAIACMLLALVATTAIAQTDDLAIRLSTGVDYTSGDYGGTEDIEDTYMPVTATVDRGRLGFRVTVPYLRVRAPSGTVITDAAGQPVPGTGARVTESGLGDIIGSVTVYDVFNNRERGVALDLSGRIKFGTADRAKGLGTGENDYSVQADFYKFFDRFTLLASAGYKNRGDPAGLDLENVLLGSMGAIYRISSSTRVGLVYDYRESAFSTGEAIREITGFVSQRLNETWRMQFYLINGLSNSSPDWGGGFLLKASL